jgi:NitT/TauT family transport system permease protein
VIPVFVEELRGDLWDHTLISAQRVLSAITLAVLIATPIGLGLGQIRILNRIFSPLIGLVHPVPKVVFLPVILVVMGIGETSKVFLIALILFFQILVVVRDEAAGLRPELIQSVRSLGAGRRALFRYVYLPASVPAVLTALRISVGTAIAVLFIAEQYSTRSGLGYYIVTLSWQRLHFEEMYAGIMAMSLLGLTLFVAVDVLERVFGRWRRVGE